jgi:hypothetical protein
MLSIKHESLMIYYQMIILYSICYVEIQLHRVSKFVVLMYICYLTDMERTITFILKEFKFGH